jgi:proteasome lid subunit RPN8/RPN11
MMVFKPAIIANSPAIICTHAHPSGDPAPSREDRDCTARLVKAGAILGIRVLDQHLRHIVFLCRRRMPPRLIPTYIPEANPSFDTI